MTKFDGLARTADEARKRGYEKIEADPNRDASGEWIHISHDKIAKVGDICYIGPCHQDGSGTRPVCYIDGNGACDDCFNEPDNVCD